MIISGQERAGRTPTSDTSGDLPRSWRRPRWAVTLDAAVIGALAAFAWWTLLYEVMLAEGWPTTPVMVGWLVTAPFVAVPIARWNIEHARRAEDENWRVPLRPISRPERKTMLLVAVAVVVCAVLMGTTTHALFRVGWGIGIIGLLAVGHALRRGAAPASPAGDVRADVAPNVPPSMRRTWDDVVAVVVSCGVAIASLFVVRTSSDDVYYVNLSTWIAEHGHIPLRDTMYGDQTYPSSYGGGFPLSSIEAQLGALARLFDVRAGTIAYLVVAPLCTFASMWVLWQLALLWSRRGPMPAFLFSVVFVLAGAGGGYRSYSTVRIWQGKVMAFAIVIPLIWIFATRLARTRDRHWAVLLSLAGVAFVGLTSTAALLGLTLACAIALAAVILMNRSLLWGVLALAVPALVSGTTVAVLSRSVGGATPTAPTAWAAVRAAYGAHPTMAIVTIAAVMVAPLLVRGTAAATLIWCSGVASLAVLTPGVLSFLNAVTGSGPVEWRLLLSPPAPTLIGLCAATGVAAATRGLTSRPVATRIVSAAATLAVVFAFMVVGTPPWSSTVRVESRPSWKVSVKALANVRAVVAANPSTTGPLLLPAAEMRVLAIYTTRWFAVLPRAFDLPGLAEPAATTAARRTLLQLVSTTKPNPSAADVESALHTLNVTTVCLSPSDVGARVRVRAAGYSSFRPVGGMRCSVRTR